MTILISTNHSKVYTYISTYRGKQIELNCRNPSLHLNANIKHSNGMLDKYIHKGQLIYHCFSGKRCLLNG